MPKHLLYPIPFKGLYLRQIPNPTPRRVLPGTDRVWQSPKEERGVGKVTASDNTPEGHTMKAATKMGFVLAVSTLLAGTAQAASWQDQLNSAATALNQNSNSGTNANGGNSSMAALTGLLNGGNKSLSANSMTNAAGILQYCAQNNIVNNNVTSVKDQLMSKLGLADTQKAQQTTDYKQGLMGLLNTGSDQQVNLSSLGNTPVAQKVKTKACDLVLKQGKQFIS